MSKQNKGVKTGAVGESNANLEESSNNDIYANRAIVQRHFHKNDYRKSQPTRHITVYYEYDRINKILRYGAVIVQKDKSIKLNVKELLEAAKKRFVRGAVKVRDFEDNGTKEEFHCAIRDLLYTKGCRAPLNSNESKESK